MHKKYNKYVKKDVLHRTSSHKRTHVKHKKETNDSLNELIKVPQNSKCDMGNYGDKGNIEIHKSRHRHKEKHRHRKADPNKSAEHRGKTHERRSAHRLRKPGNLLFQNERLVKHKENHSKREKRDKERLNKIEKYLEGLNAIPHKERGRNRSSVSLRTTENSHSKKKHIRRENTFHGEISRTRESYHVVSETKKLRDHNKHKEKDVKKHKHRESKGKDSNKEKETKSTEKEIKNAPKSIFFCQMDNPLETFAKQVKVEKQSSQIYKDHKRRSSHKAREHSSSKHRSTSRDEMKLMKIEKNSKHREHSGHVKERKTPEPNIKSSQRKVKMKSNLRKKKEVKGNVTLRSYDKYFVIDKKSESEYENKHHKKSHHGKHKENCKKAKNDNLNENTAKEERKQKKKISEKRSSRVKEYVPTQDQFREKIEDDLKSYFMKIQTLIDKKLEFILHGGKENINKINNSEKEHITGTSQSRKRRRSASKEEEEARRRSKSLRHHRSRKVDNSGSRDTMQGGRRSHTPMPVSHQRHHNSLTKPDRENLGATSRLGSNEREPRHKRHSGSQHEFNESTIRNRSVSRLENPSAHSMKSKKSYSGERVAVKEKKSEGKFRPKHVHKVTNTENNQNYTHRDSSLIRRNITLDELTCVAIANNFDLVGLDVPEESHSKRPKNRPLNLECKTVSIIGIPSQMRESIIFNETQTTTSLNIIDIPEEAVERKKKSKRFKLYYKYSLANNSCVKSDSDQSSDGKSIVSDSYRIVSGNSEHNSEVCSSYVERDDPKDSRKILFVMKRESLANISGDTTDNQIALEHFSRKCRKHKPLTPAASKLNNIVEEPSNMSCLAELDRTIESLNTGLHCKYFNILNSSSSVCNLHLMKKSAVSDWNIPMGRCKCRIFDNSDITTVKIHDTKPQGEECSLENKWIKTINLRNDNPKKIKHNKIIRDFGEIYTSKSDIDISYDSLHMDKNYEIKTIKKKRKANLSSHLIETNTYTPSEINVLINLQGDTERPKRTELQVKESVCQTESEVDKDAIDALAITKAYKKYFEDMLESHRVRNQEDIRSTNQDTNTETIIQQPRKKTYLEVSRIPSLLSKRCVESLTPEINLSVKEIAEDIPQKHTRRSLIPERTKFNQNKVDVGVEASYLDEKLKILALDSPHRNISPSKPADGPAADVSVNIPKLNFNNGVGRNTENTDESTGLVESQRPPTPKENRLINRDPPYTRPPSQQSNISSFSQRRTSSIRTAEIIRPVRLPIYQKLSYSAKHKVREIERPGSAKEKSQKTKAHEVARSMSTVIKLKKPSMSDFKRKPRLIVKCAKTRDPPTKKCIAINTSRLTVLRKNITQKHIRSNSCSRKSRHSSKCADLTMPKSNFSFSEIHTETAETEESKVTSLVCLNQFIYGTKLNSAPTSHARSLDRYTAKSINNHNHSSRLFLTKDYIPQLNTYQRRKLYSEGLRKKMMKKNCQNRNVIAPQIFEVRYLSLEKDKFNGESEATARSNCTTYNSSQFSSNKLNSSVRKCYRKKASPRATPVKKSRKNTATNKEHINQFSNKDSHLTPTKNMDSLSKSRKKQLPEVKIEDIFIKKNKLNEDKDIIKKNEIHEDKYSNILDIYRQLTNTPSSSVVMREDTVSLDEFNSENNPKSEQNLDTDNFMHLINYLCKSIADHCNSDNKLPPNDCLGPPQENKATSNTKQPTDVNDANAKHETELSTIDDPCEISADKKESKSKSNDKDKAPYIAANPTICVSLENTLCMRKPSTDQYKVTPKHPRSAQVSCPAFADTASSFEFLYEDDSEELSKGAIMESLTKPWDTILGYALHRNDTVVIRKETYTSVGNKIDQISNSPTDSEESGYSTNSSERCLSAASFFKKPYVAALFKSPISEVEAQNEGSRKALIKSNHSLRNYNLMSEKCQDYRDTEESDETFQEIPINILLQKNSSSVLGQCASDCSICKEYIDEREAFKTNFVSRGNESDIISKSNTRRRVFLEEERFDIFGESENQLETLIYYGNPKCKPSLEIIKQNSKTSSVAVEDCSTLEEKLNDFPMVVSNTNLHRRSLTLLDVRQSEDYIKEESLANNEIIEESTNRSKCNEPEIAHGGSIQVNEISVNCPSEGNSNDEEITDDDLEDISTDNTSNIVSTFSVRASETKKLMAKKFFENLLRVYEKEMAVTTRLFQDDDFFENDLLGCVNDAEEKKKRKGKFKKIRGYIGNVFAPKNTQSQFEYDTDQRVAKYQNFDNFNQNTLKVLAFTARRYFSMFVQAVKANKNINDELKICGLLKILQRIENGDFTILRTNEEVNFESELKHQVKEAFINIYEISLKEAKKHKRSLTIDDLKLIKAFVSKYRIGLLSKTDIIATYIGRGIFKTEKHLSAAVAYLIRTQSKDVDLEEFEKYCQICTSTEK